MQLLDFTIGIHSRFKKYMRDELELSRISIWQYYLFEKNKYELEKAKGALGPEAPRLVATEDSAAYETSRQSYKDTAALGEVLTPEDCADAIVYLLGATKVTGQLLRVDGGRSVGRLPGRPA